jgi:hypothetical protein
MQPYHHYHTLLEDIDAVNTIIGVAELLRSEAEGEGDAKTSMNSFLNMLQNAGLNINYDGLKAYYESDPRLQAEIQDFNEKEVVFVGDDAGLDMKPQGEVSPEKKVNSMAKAALAKRESIEEVSRATLASYQSKASDARGHRNLPFKKVDNRYTYVKKASDKLEKMNTDLPGLEGPFTTRSGKVVYYDPKEGKYYDRDSDMYLSYDEFKDYDQSRASMGSKMELPKGVEKESIEETFDYWQGPESIAKLAGLRKPK